MKLRISLLTIIFALVSTAALAQNVQSDYEIQKTFKQKFAEYQDQLDRVSSPDSAKKLITDIKSFDEEYQAHSELLNKVLHPATYQEQIKELKESSVLTLNRLQTIKTQAQRLDTLEMKVVSYENNLQQLNSRTDSLQKAIEKSNRSEQQLAAMVREYRSSLEKRDELILAFIDSMVVAYQKMDYDALQDLENMDEKSRFKSDGDALKMIHDITMENVQILQNNSQNLLLEDYMRMAEVQQQFETMWNRLGNNIQEVYAGGNAEEIAANVDQNIAQWDSLIQNQSLAALRTTMADNNIRVIDFQNTDEFYTALNQYLNTNIQQSKKNASEASYSEFQNFKQFWNRVEMDWASNFADAGLLNKTQMSTINGKVDQWAGVAEPSSDNLFAYLFGGSMILVVALSVMLFRQRKNNKTT